MEENGRDVDPLSDIVQQGIDHDSDVNDDDALLEEQFEAEMDAYLKKALDKGDEPGSDPDDPMYADDIGQEKYLESGFNEDLYIAVGEPEKHVQAMESFITYKVTTKTTRSSFDSSEFVVRRRYHDFIWLSEMLQVEYPTYIIPPLPAKLIMKGLLDRFNDDFTKTRCRGLNKFLQRVSNHPVLSHSESLGIFLTSENFTPSNKQGLLSRVSGSLKSNRISSKEFEDLVIDLSLFGEKIGVMDRIGERMLSERKELSNELKGLSLATTNWSKYEEDVIESAMLTMSNCLEECAEKVDTTQGAHLLEIVPTVKEYTLYADAVKQALKRRDEFEGQFVKSKEELNARCEEKENLLKTDQAYSLGALMGKSPSQIRQEKEEKLDEQISDLSRQTEKLHDSLVKANYDFRTEIERWKKQKTLDISATFSQLAETQVAFHANCLKAWNKTVSTIQSSPKTEDADDSAPPI